MFPIFCQPKSLLFSLIFPCFYKKFMVTIQDSGRAGGKIRVKLACKRVFLPALTSEESPMLLVRLCRTRRCPALNSYNFSTIKIILYDLPVLFNGQSHNFYFYFLNIMSKRGLYRINFRYSVKSPGKFTLYFVKNVFRISELFLHQRFVKLLDLCNRGISRVARTACICKCRLR